MNRFRACAVLAALAACGEPPVSPITIGPDGVPVGANGVPNDPGTGHTRALGDGYSHSCLGDGAQCPPAPCPCADGSTLNGPALCNTGTCVPGDCESICPGGTLKTAKLVCAAPESCWRDCVKAGRTVAKCLARCGKGEGPACWSACAAAGGTTTACAESCGVATPCAVVLCWDDCMKTESSFDKCLAECGLGDAQCDWCVPLTAGIYKCHDACKAAGRTDCASVCGPI